MTTYNVCVVGATGLVGQTIRDILEERQFPVKELIPFATSRSAGKKITFNGEEYTIQELTEDSFKNNEIDIALFAAGGDVSKQYAPLAMEAGAFVIDNSSYYRMDETVPLVVPEVNASDISQTDRLVANPNCSTTQSVVALKPLEDDFGLKRVVYNTYQAVSGSGHKGLNDLKDGTTTAYKYSIQDNVLPQIDVFLENGYTKEEMKMVNETHKILGNKDLPITATAARVPIANGHAISINAELSKPFELEDVVDSLSKGAGITIVDDTNNDIYPLEEEASGTDQVYIGRIRRDFSVENGVNIWVVADNIRKGAATNTVQIAENIVENILA